MSHLAAPLDLSVPSGQQGVVKFRQLLIQTELTLGEILPHAHQLALKKSDLHDCLSHLIFSRGYECDAHLVTFVVVRKKLWHSVDLCEYFNKQLGLVCRKST